MTNASGRHAVPTRAHAAPIVVFLLSVLSLGVYVPVWYLLRRESLNRLAEGLRFSPAPALGLLALVLMDQFGVLSPLTAHDLNGMLMLSGLSGVLMIAAAMLLLVLRLRALRLIAAACAERPDSPRPSKLATMLVGEAYLQARLNGLHEPAPVERGYGAPAAPAAL